MEKIAVIVSVSPDERETMEILHRIKADFAVLGAEIVFFGKNYGGSIRPLDELPNFHGTLINLSQAFDSTESADIMLSPEDEGKAAPLMPETSTGAGDISGLKLTVEGTFLDKSGYALHTRNMALGLDKMGADVKLISLWFAGAPEIQRVDRDAPRDEGYIYLTRDDGSLHRYKSQVDPEKTQRVIELCQKEVETANRTMIAALPPYSPTDEIYRKIIARREEGEKYRKYIGYTMFETGDLPRGWTDACRLMDEIWVPSTFNYESFIRGGVDQDKMRIVPLGVDVDFFDPQKTPAMEIPGVKGFNFLSIFQWTKRKGWDILLKAYLSAFKFEDDVALVIRSYRGTGREVESIIREYIEEQGRDISAIPRISVISEPIPSQHMPALYKACNAFVLPTRGEGWGLPYMEAMAMGMPVIGTAYSAQLDFMNDANSYLIENLGLERVDEDQVMDDAQYLGTTWGKPSLEHTIELMRQVYENRDEAQNTGFKARQDILDNWTVGHQVARTANTLLEKEYMSAAVAQTPIVKQSAPTAIGRKEKPLRVVMQNRPNSLDAPGGDTVVMNNLKRELEKMGVRVDFSFKLDELSDYDIVHVFNFVLPDMIKLYAENALKHNKPIVITPMYEDWPLFLNKSTKMFPIFKEYLDRNQDKSWFKQAISSLNRLRPHDRTDNSYNIRLAGGIGPSGDSEADRIIKEYPYARNVKPVYLGCDVTENEVGPELFIDEFGLKDFVLCVARLETRKNQLMLLKALEDEDIPLVFAAGGFTYQEEYADLCRRFRRPGKTVFLGRLSDEMLVSAYKAAKVHALPSWYELPGMVSVEAAHYDCSVVASPWGTIEDYLGEFGFYCEPDDPDDIRRALLQALESSVDPAQKQHVKQFTWKRSADTMLDIYSDAIDAHRKFNDCKLEADAYKSAGDIDAAIDAYVKALDIHPDHPETLKLTVELMQLKKHPESEAYSARLNLLIKDASLKKKSSPAFIQDEEMSEKEEAFMLLKKGLLSQASGIFENIIHHNPNDHEALYGLGQTAFAREDYIKAREFFRKAADIKATGDNLIALAGVLEKLNEIDEALISLNLLHELPGVNGSFEFDYNRLKGHCMLKQGKFDEAEKCYHRSRIIDRSSEKPFLGLGSIELMKKNYAVADQYYRKALELNLDSDKAYLGLAVVRMEQGDHVRAFEEAKKALNLRIENQQALMVLIQNGHKTDRLDEVENYLEQYSSLHPANAEILFTLAGIKYKLGRRDDALQTARKILIFDPQNDAAVKLIEEIEN